MADMMGPPRQEPTMPRTPVEANRSMMNPVDLAAKAQSGQVGPNMTIEDWLNQMGLSPVNSIKDLMMAVRKQHENGNPMQQMQNIAADSQQAGGSPAPAPAGGPPGRPTDVPSGGLAGLRQKLGA